MQDLNHGSTGAPWGLHVGAFESAWSEPCNNVDYPTADKTGFRWQLEARLHVPRKLGGIDGSQIQPDRSRGVGGVALAQVEGMVTSVGHELDGQWKPAPFIFKALVNGSNGLGEILGVRALFAGVQERGSHARAGDSFVPNWSIDGFYGMIKRDIDEVIAWMGHGAAGRLENHPSVLSPQYSGGANNLDSEWMHDKLDPTTDGNPLSLSTPTTFSD
ncbi:MAG: hypothetical protein ABI268_08110 [Rhodanobacter sp.]